MTATLVTYWHTLRHLRPRQVLYQVWRQLRPPRLQETVPWSPRWRDQALIPGPSRPRTYLEQGAFRFLHRPGDTRGLEDWQPAGQSHLWLYNLHYFDYLRQPGMASEAGLELITAWIRHHRPAVGAVGWEPYPTSLRLVNWLKFLASGPVPPSPVLDSLGLQAVNLARQVEYQILGNHLFANGKALWFAGRFLDREDLARRGRRIVLSQLPEQFLPDGGHFELSPMYHALMLEDLLDLINLCQTSPPAQDRAARDHLTPVARRALGWLGGISDAAGCFPLVNDAAYGIAPEWGDLADYARRLELAPDFSPTTVAEVGGWQGCNLSGYWLLERGPLRLLFDTAPLGPRYLPGHAHCDMLAIQLEAEGRPVFTDTGVYEYAEGPRRHYSRSTLAHNTVRLDGHEQAELWKSFRMGRRGGPTDFRREENRLACSHTGFAIWQPGLLHEREIALKDQGFEVTDSVRGPGSHSFQSVFHCHPDTEIQTLGEHRYRLNGRLLLTIWGAAVDIIDTDYYPEFGRLERRPSFILRGDFSRQGRFGISCTYSS